MYFTSLKPFLLPGLPGRNSCFCFLENRAVTSMDTSFLKIPAFLLPKTDYGKKSLFFNASCFLGDYINTYICMLLTYIYLFDFKNCPQKFINMGSV
jgi:hypothetical protein